MPSDNWTVAIPLSTIGGNYTENPEIEVYINYVHVIWEENNNILYRRSEDHGETWSDIITFISNQEYNATEPDIAVKGQNVYIVWVDETIVPDDSGLGIEDIYGSIYCKTSNDHGKSWSGDFKITGDHSHMPCIDIENNEIHIVWSENNYYLTVDLYTYYQFKIYYSKFENNEWQTPILLNESTKWYQVYRSNPNPKVKAILNSVHIVWEGEEWNGTYGTGCILYVNSNDNGNHWNSLIRLSQENLSAYDLCIGCTNTDIFVFYTDNNGIGYNHSADNGINWIKGQTLGEGFESDIFVNNEKIIIVFSKWMVNQSSNLFFSSAINNGENWNNITQLTNNATSRVFIPKIMVTNEYIHIIWLEGKSVGNELYYTRYYNNSFIITPLDSADSDNDGYPDEIDAFPNNSDYYLDTDKDGMPDAWEDEHNLNKTDPSDALLDPDDDGKPNNDEFEDETDPFVSDNEQEHEIDYMIFIAINIIILLVLVFIIILLKIKKSNK